MARDALAAMSSWANSLSTRGTCVASCFPRTRGDEPKPSAAQKLVKEFPPHTRGWVLKNKAELTALHFLLATLFQARGGYRLGT